MMGTKAGWSDYVWKCYASTFTLILIVLVWMHADFLQYSFLKMPFLRIQFCLQ